MISAQKPFFNVKKILLDSYEQETSAGGNRYPKARWIYSMLLTKALWFLII